MPNLEQMVIECCQCGKKDHAQIITIWADWVSTLPAGWLVMNVFPPSDKDFRFACSIECVQKWVLENYPGALSFESKSLLKAGLECDPAEAVSLGSFAQYAKDED